VTRREQAGHAGVRAAMPGLTAGAELAQGWKVNVRVEVLAPVILPVMVPVAPA
jgi:hypothetical protein